MTVEQAENWLDEYKARENAEAADDVETWDEAYAIALEDHIGEPILPPTA